MGIPSDSRRARWILDALTGEGFTFPPPSGEIDRAWFELVVGKADHVALRHLSLAPLATRRGSKSPQLLAAAFHVQNKTRVAAVVASVLSALKSAGATDGIQWVDVGAGTGSLLEALNECGHLPKRYIPIEHDEVRFTLLRETMRDFGIADSYRPCRIEEDRHVWSGYIDPKLPCVYMMLNVTQERKPPPTGDDLWRWLGRVPAAPHHASFAFFVVTCKTERVHETSSVRSSRMLRSFLDMAEADSAYASVIAPCPRGHGCDRAKNAASKTPARHVVGGDLRQLSEVLFPELLLCPSVRNNEITSLEAGVDFSFLPGPALAVRDGRIRHEAGGATCTAEVVQ